MTRTIFVPREPVPVEVPDGATHYTGDLLECPTFYKFSVSENGVCRHWCWYRPGWNRGPNGERQPPGWYIHGEHQPHWLKELPRG